MNDGFTEEKRLSKRYLCDEFFELIGLEVNQHSFSMTAIDFNKDGIGLFSNDAIPECGNVTLTLRYHSPAFNYIFKDLSCSIVHCNLTEVGSHCGLHFNQSKLSSNDKKALETIEEQLIKSDDPDDRYHLFGEY